MKPKTYKCETDFGTYDVKLNVDTYMYGGGIYVKLLCNDPDVGYWVPFAHITTNVYEDFCPTSVEELDMAAIDTNNCPWAEKFLTDNKLAVDTGRKVRSGFCTYPIYKFDRKVLEA